MEPFGLEYEVVNPLGKGSFAQVSLAREIKTRKLFAVKVFKKEDGSSNLNNFINKPKVLNPLSEPPYVVERRALETLALDPHPNMAQLHAAFEDDNYVLLVMTYAEGGDMLTWLERRHNQETGGLARVSEFEIKVLFYHILSAVAHFHSLGLCHRDIKLENILLDKQCQPIIIDFNLSSKWSSTQTMSTHCGSLFYTPPEMFQNKKYVGPEVDVWSLGVVLYAMMFKRFPFMASTDVPGVEGDLSIAHNIVKGSYPLPNATQLYSMEALSLLTSLLVKDGYTRPTCAALLRHPWFNGINNLKSSSLSNIASATHKAARHSYAACPPPEYDEQNNFFYGADVEDDEVDVKTVKKGRAAKEPHAVKGGKKGADKDGRERKMTVSERVAVVKFFCKSVSKRLLSV